MALRPGPATVDPAKRFLGRSGGGKNLDLHTILAAKGQIDPALINV
jgi:hypothetical protein